jgi:UDP-N-acetyl-D-glucosamine dehydrogenase
MIFFRRNEITPDIFGWLKQHGLWALTTGVIAGWIAVWFVLSRPPEYQAKVRILDAINRSADAAEAFANDPVIRQSAGVTADSGTPEQLLEGGLLELRVRAADPTQAALHAAAWAEGVCAAAGWNNNCVGEVIRAPLPLDDHGIWKTGMAALAGAILGLAGSYVQNGWNQRKKEFFNMAKSDANPVELPQTAKVLIQKLARGKARIGVVGLGYVGLPLVDAFGRAGFDVTGIDVDERKVEMLRKGKSYIEDISSSRVAELARKGVLHATTDFRVVETLDAISICVPTPLRKTGDPDLSFIVNVADQIARYVHPGMVIVLESTTYPGTTREIMLPKLESHGLKVGKDFFLAFSPERVDPGRTDWTTVNTPKVIGGMTPACLKVASAYYGRAIKTLVPVSSTEAAEMTKLLENTFRAVNIGLVNEVAIMCDKLGMDVWEVIDAAASKPFGYMKFTPGPGLGGHCIPIDPLYLSWKLKAFNYNARFIELATEINTNMPRVVVQKVQDALNNKKKPLRGSRILVLGVAYKPDVSDLRESPALDVIGLLRQKGAVVDYHDPYVGHLEHDSFSLTCIPDLEGGLQQADCVVITTNHSTYSWKRILAQSKLIVDTRNALGELGRNDEKVVRL